MLNITIRSYDICIEPCKSLRCKICVSRLERFLVSARRDIGDIRPLRHGTRCVESSSSTIQSSRRSNLFSHRVNVIHTIERASGCRCNFAARSHSRVADWSPGRLPVKPARFFRSARARSECCTWDSPFLFFSSLPLPLSLSLSLSPGLTALFLAIYACIDIRWSQTCNFRVRRKRRWFC